MREAASRGFWMGTYAPFGYRRSPCRTESRHGPKLEPDPPADAVIKRIFDMALQGRAPSTSPRPSTRRASPAPRGKQWLKSTIHTTLNNEAYTGARCLGSQCKGRRSAGTRGEAHPVLVSKRKFRQVANLLRSRAPETVHPRRASSPYLLSGLVKCETCGKALTAAEAKSGKYTYYVCHSLLKKRQAERLRDPQAQRQVLREASSSIQLPRANVLTESNIRDLVKSAGRGDGRGGPREQRERLEIYRRMSLRTSRSNWAAIWNFIARSDSDIERGPGFGPHRGTPGAQGEAGRSLSGGVPEGCSVGAAAVTLDKMPTPSRTFAQPR